MSKTKSKKQTPIAKAAKALSKVKGEDEEKPVETTPEETTPGPDEVKPEETTPTEEPPKEDKDAPANGKGPAKQKGGDAPQMKLVEENRETKLERLFNFHMTKQEQENELETAVEAIKKLKSAIKQTDASIKKVLYELNNGQITMVEKPAQDNVELQGPHVGDKLEKTKAS